VVASSCVRIAGPGDAVAGAEPGAIVDRGVGPTDSQRDRLCPTIAAPGEEVRFALDSLLEEAVTSELVSGRPKIPC
jgi:hypothetical protein